MCANHSECMECVDNSTLNYGDCLCDIGWSGHNCLDYEGDCLPRCKSCHDSTRCEQCTTNAELVGYECECNHLYSGELCDMYVGECTHLCSVC